MGIDTIRSALRGVTLIAITAILGSACGRSTDDRSSPASGGASGSSAGVSSTGGNATLEGGSNGDSGTGAQTSSAGADAADAGAAGAPVINAGCTSNQQCGIGFCRFPEQRCVSCLVHSNCADNEACIHGTCEKTSICNVDTDCASGKKCDPVWRRCLECSTDADCGAAATCDSGACRPVSPCKNSLDCREGVCDEHRGHCVECATSVDCKRGERCANSTCVAAPNCTSDRDCKAAQLLCDKGQGQCMQCLNPSDCPAFHRCSDGRCAPALCEVGKAVCTGETISHCNAGGDGLEPSAPCADGEHCRYSHGVAACASCPKLPLDVIWLVKNDAAIGELSTAYGTVIDQVHQSLKQSGVGIRTVLISRMVLPIAKQDAMYCMDGRGVCVPTPTGSAVCPGGTSEFLHIDQFVDDPLVQIHSTYKGWQDFLRPEAKKVFLVVSNRSSLVYSASSFTQMVGSLVPPLGNVWSLSGVFCTSATCSGGQLQCGEVKSDRCIGGAPYVTLAADTGGFAVDFCTTDPAASAAPLTAGLLKAATPTSCP